MSGLAFDLCVLAVLGPVLVWLIWSTRRDMDKLQKLDWMLPEPSQEAFEAVMRDMRATSLPTEPVSTSDTPQEPQKDAS